jgi:NADH:ubiquinone oxidoreductase subunit F (NADH-binding)
LAFKCPGLVSACVSLAAVSNILTLNTQFWCKRGEIFDAGIALILLVGRASVSFADG